MTDPKTQDESQWIVSQRILSALTIPGFDSVLEVMATMRGQQPGKGTPEKKQPGKGTPEKKEEQPQENGCIACGPGRN